MRRFKIQNSRFKINILCCLLILAILNACNYTKQKVYKKTKILMDTIVMIKVVSDSKEQAEQAINSAFEEIERLEKLFDYYSTDSEISEINRNAGISKVKVSPDMIYVLDKSLFVSKETDGAFDVTMGPVNELYDFHRGIKPSEYKIKRKLALVNYRDLIIDKDDSTVFLKKRGMRIDLGGIVKGYAADIAVETLKRLGITSGIVSIAGDIKTFGNRYDGKPWLIGIRNPRAEGKNDDIVATIYLREKAISTSGDYERYFMLNGKRYHHLLSPETGHPVSTCRSVSIIANEGIYTDSFATGVFILGPEKGIKVIEKLGFEGFIIDSKGNIHITPGIRRDIEIKGTY